MSNHHTPSDLKITPRDVHFDYAKALKENRYWHNNDPITTHFFNALQATFPEGERYFIDSARDTRDEIGKENLPQKLKDDIQLFIQQEAFHGREHDAWCAALDELGYTKLKEMDEEQAELRKWSRKNFAPITRLASTAAGEHFTAVIASLMLYDRPDLIEDAEEPFRSAFLYHTLEEVEHKAVCFDLFKQAGGGYIVRQFGFLVVLLSIIYQVRTRNIYLLKTDGLWNSENKRKARKLIWGKGGLIRALLPKILAYLRPSFHPWETDERKEFIEKFGHYLDKAGVPST